MGIFHYLNVKQGDCSIIQHPSDRVTVIDVCNASKQEPKTGQLQKGVAEAFGARGNFNRKDYPVNPISYLADRGINSVFRFILTHPDMDHMDGISEFFDAFSPINFWDTENHCEKEFEENGPYDEDDWLFYKSLREGRTATNPKRLTLLSGAEGQFYNRCEDGTGGGDGLHVLAPTQTLIDNANANDDYNDASYVILYQSNGGRILLAGDSHDESWAHVLANHKGDVKDVDLLIAPHHGRASDRSYDFLDVVNPALTFFGNANSEHLAYGAWNYRKLPFITNNQADCMVVDTNTTPMQLYVTNRAFAVRCNPQATYSATHKAYYVGAITR